MELINQYHYIAAAFIARVFLGCLFFFQGFDAVFAIRMRNVVSTFKNNFEGKPIPGFLLTLTAWFTSYTELIGGACLILGLFTYPALYLLGINLILAAVGFGMKDSLWDTRYVLPRLMLLLLLLSIPDSWNIFSLDYFFN